MGYSKENIGSDVSLIIFFATQKSCRIQLLKNVLKYPIGGVV